MSKKPIDKTAMSPLSSHYSAAVSFWIHAEQERWSILNNCFMSNTILLLAWAAIYASANSFWLPLLLFSVVGFVQSLGWAAVTYRTACFIKAYGKSGEEVEKEFIGDTGPMPGPFSVGQVTREVLKRNWLVRWFTARNFTIGMSLLFCLVFVVLAILSISAIWQ